MASLKSVTAGVRSSSKSFGVGFSLKAVDRSAPQRKSPPVEHLRGQLVVFWNGRQVVVEALQSRAVAFVVRPLNLRDDMDDGIA